MVLSRLFYKRRFSIFQLKVLDGGNNGRLILAKDDLNSGQLIFKYVFSKSFQSKRLLKYDTYMES